jgi:3-mercaptopyruvate sulfurtransferase SseA
VTYLALRLLGYEQPTNYDGAWRDWERDPKGPIDK